MLISYCKLTFSLHVKASQGLEYRFWWREGGDSHIGA